MFEDTLCQPLQLLSQLRNIDSCSSSSAESSAGAIGATPANLSVGCRSESGSLPRRQCRTSGEGTRRLRYGCGTRCNPLPTTASVVWSSRHLCHSRVRRNVCPPLSGGNGERSPCCSVRYRCPSRDMWRSGHVFRAIFSGGSSRLHSSNCQRDGDAQDDGRARANKGTRLFLEDSRRADHRIVADAHGFCAFFVEESKMTESTQAQGATTLKHTDLLRLLVCPRDKKDLSHRGTHLICPQGHQYAVVDGVPILLVSDVEQTHIEGTRALVVAETGDPSSLPE